jgi:ABC transporter DrrB family efflux protein
MMRKEFRELRRDRRTVAMLVVLPILLLVIFGYAANFSVTTLKTVVVGPPSTASSVPLPSVFDVSAKASGPGSSPLQILSRGEAAVVIDATTSPPTAWVDGADLFSAQAAVGALAKAGYPGARVLFNPHLKTSWYMVPSVIGLILTFIGTVITSIGLVREREAGTLEQLAVMPLRPIDVIGGKIAPYFVLASIDLVLVTLLGAGLFGVPFAGNLLVYAVGAAMFLFAVLGLGVLISTLSQTQGQAIQGALLVLLPQVLLSGMIFPLSAMPWAVRWIGYLLPLTYFTMISRGVMLRGSSFSSLGFPLLMLLVMAIVIFTLAVLRFRRDLAPTRGTPTSAASAEG